LSALLAVYGFIQIKGLLVPSLWADEAYDGVFTQQIIRLGWKGFRNWPLGLGPYNYHAALQSYLYVPFFLLIKSPFLALRVGEFFFSSVVIVLAYLCARRFFGPLAALFTLVLLLFNPVFIYMSRINTPHGGVMAAFWLGALLFLQTWRKTGHDRWLFAAAFLTGAGFCVRIWFYWFIFGLLFSALVVYRQELAGLFFRPLNRRRIAGVGAAFLLGLVPYALKETRSVNPDLFRIGVTFFHHGVNGSVDNFAILHNWGVSFWQFLGALAGGLWDFWLFNRLDHNNFISFMMIYCGFLFALSVGVLLLLKTARGSQRSRALFFITLLLGMFLPSCLTLSTFRQDHLYFIFPLPQIIMGAAAAILFERARVLGPSSRVPLMTLILIAALPVLYLWQYSKRERFFRRTGGTGTVSDSIIAITNWLEKHDYSAPICGDWGFGGSKLLSDGKIRPIDIYPSLESNRRFFFLHRSGDDVYLFYTAHGNLQSASAALARQGLAFKVRKTFYTRNGEPNAVALTIVKRGPRR